MNTKTKAKAHVTSETIEQATVYVQSMAAYEAGFQADATGNWVHAGAGSKLGSSQLQKAGHALRRLVAISPAGIGGRPALSPEELLAKAAVLAVVTKQVETFSEPSAIEMAYISLFAVETVDCLRTLRTGEAGNQ